jgi:hypothetical protein
MYELLTTMVLHVAGEEAENFVRTFSERPEEPPSLEEYQVCGGVVVI